MTSTEIRRAFLDYFESLGHRIVPSSSLVPNDPTLLLTNAGMVQFKGVFLGLETRPYTRAVSVQKCCRLSGKHNDLEQVGPSLRHHTFFEMLGNFSFGDYFKGEAIQFAHEFITGVLGLDSNRLIFTVFEDDDVAYDAWLGLGVPPERILRMGEKTNFWAMGDTGPCGPTSELHFDWGAESCTCGQPDCSVALDNGCQRWLEIWNLVFMQYDQQPGGQRTPLPRHGVDTGMGLERIAAVMQGKRSDYETDLFQPITERIITLIGACQKDSEEQAVALRVIADHARATAFLLSDGVLPSNEKQGYILRMVMRRAIRFGRKLGWEQPFLGKVCEAVIDSMGAAYPELVERGEFILSTIAQEEERFANTLDLGLEKLCQLMENLKAKGLTTIPGEEAFRLHDTYGFPLELTRDIASERGFSVEVSGYQQEMEKQRERARRITAQDVLKAGEWAEVLQPTVFVGYDTLTAQSVVLRVIKSDDQSWVVLDRTPFYAEQGGQAGDTGLLSSEQLQLQLQFQAKVLDTQRWGDVIAHKVQIERGLLTEGVRVEAQVDEPRRNAIRRAHTATHLLHAVLRQVLGAHVLQSGSLVEPDRLRFDFSHPRPVSEEDVMEIERTINAYVLSGLEVEVLYKPLEEARAMGAMALFGEKYGETVRVVRIPDVSIELCGGTHLSNTSHVGLFKIVSETGVGANLRRVEALTGFQAMEWVNQRLRLLEQTASLLSSTPERLLQAVIELEQQRKGLERKLRDLEARTASSQLEQLLQSAVEVKGVKVIAKELPGVSSALLRQLADQLTAQLVSGIVVLGSIEDGKVVFVSKVTKDVQARGGHAGNLLREVARIAGGGGGGRADFAQAGGKDPEKLNLALAKVVEVVAKQLHEKR